MCQGAYVLGGDQTSGAAHLQEATALDGLLLRGGGVEDPAAQGRPAALSTSTARTSPSWDWRR